MSNQQAKPFALGFTRFALLTSRNGLGHPSEPRRLIGRRASVD